MDSGGLELTKLTYTRLEDNLIRHRGDLNTPPQLVESFILSRGSPNKAV